MAPIKVLLVDDHTVVREMLTERLARESSLEIVAAAATADEAIALAAAHRPDVIVMDIDMPGVICFDAARTIRARLPDVALLFLSGHTHDHYIEQALAVGALGYLTKTEPPARIVQAIRDVAANRASFSESVLARVVFDGAETRLAGTWQSRASTLSPREVEVLRYLARGMAKKQVAAVMHVSVKTVEKHTENLMDKLAIHDRAELARFAIREGLSEA